MFVHSDSQLKAAHLIHGYTPISKSYQAPKCVIKARDLRLHQISVVTPSFLTTGPISEGTLTTNPILKGIPKVALPFQHATEEEATSSQPSTKGEERIVKVFDSKNDFEIFYQPLPPEIHLVTSATPFPCKQARPKETPPYQKT